MNKEKILELIKNSEDIIAKNKEKYQDILDEEDELIREIMKKYNISTKEEVLEYEEFRKTLYAVRLKKIWNRQENDTNY